MNYLRCDDLPTVFTKVLTVNEDTMLSYNNGEDKLTHPFTPSAVCMQPGTGRVYHPGPDRAGGVGLVKSLIAIDWSRDFHYEDGAEAEKDPPTHFTWHGTKYRLTNGLFEKIANVSALLQDPKVLH